MKEICGDNRFEIIARAKAALLEGTNIDTSPDEMAVINDILFRCWQMGWLDRYDRKTENSSEKPNNCKDEPQEYPCEFCRNSGSQKCEDCKDFGSNYEPKDEPKTCDNCKLKGSTKWCNNQVVCRAYKPKDEPQTEPLHTCSVNGRPYSECSSCEHFKCTADEPQTDCAWK